MKRFLLMLSLTALGTGLAGPADAFHERGGAYPAEPRYYVRPAPPPRGPFPRMMESLFGGERSRQRYLPDPRFAEPPRTYRPQPRTVRRPAPDYGAPHRSRQQPRYDTRRQAAVPAPRVRPAQRQMDPKFLPTMVPYDGGEKPGTILIDTSEKFLYLVGSDGTARRYGVGVGREGFGWTGTETISRKAEWPDWRPPASMRKRQPELPAFVAGGPDNPLGARALYLGSTLYRIHGSNEPWTIGTNVSSGCIRMRNEDVIDLYGRVKVGTTVKVI